MTVCIKPQYASSTVDNILGNDYEEARPETMVYG